LGCCCDDEEPFCELLLWFVLELLPAPLSFVIALELSEPLPDWTPESLGLVPC